MKSISSPFAFIRVDLRLNSVLLAATLLLSAPAFARETTRAAFSASAIQSQVSYLASDELRGRGSGEEGNEKAARFIAQEFARNGLKPLGTDRQRDRERHLNFRRRRWSAIRGGCGGAGRCCSGFEIVERECSDAGRDRNS